MTQSMVCLAACVELDQPPQRWSGKLVAGIPFGQHLKGFRGQCPMAFLMAANCQFVEYIARCSIIQVGNNVMDLPKPGGGRVLSTASGSNDGANDLLPSSRSLKRPNIHVLIGHMLPPSLAAVLYRQAAEKIALALALRQLV